MSINLKPLKKSECMTEIGKKTRTTFSEMFIIFFAGLVTFVFIELLMFKIVDVFTVKPDDFRISLFSAVLNTVLWYSIYKKYLKDEEQ